ncbi:MAG: ketopantoate reductase family protein [Lachnospiraceae bacterium]|nr:ketopantoate reductase family protein [Lachnospiraceae bacterium]
MWEIKKISLIGLGAMGVFFAPRLFEAYGENFRVIAEGERKKRLETQGVTINGVNYKFPVVTPEKQGDEADLILIGVKGYGLEQAIKDIRNQVGKNTLILSLLNGVDSEDKLIEAFGEEHVLYAFMRMSIVMKDGKADFDPYWGKIHFGEKLNREYSERVLSIKEVFEKADIPYEIDEDMLKGIWFKFMCNIGENMTCALLGIPFGGFRESEHANWMRINSMREVAAIAQKKGIAIGEEEIEMQNKTVMTIPYPNKPSTLQDLEACKNTEVDMFAGTVVKMGRELGVPTPICEMFYHGICVLEEKNSGIIKVNL